jgi:glycosyltransferase involved in cell wall biosynthesis
VVGSVAFAVPGALTTPTGGYAYDARIIAELRALGWTVDVLDIGDQFPRPSASARHFARGQLEMLPTSQRIVIDGLAFGALPEVAKALSQSHRLIALVHHPLALETGLSQQERDALFASERAALTCVRKVVVTSAATARILISDYDVEVDRIAIVRPGNDRAAPVTGRGNGPVSLLAVGAVVPRKGYDVLIAALGRLRDLSWRLTIVGDLTRDIQTVRTLRAEIERLGLGERILMAGGVSSQTLAAFYSSADIFTLASRFEGYGMAFAEAIAHGLPVVATAGGAIAETVPVDARILVQSDDVAAFSDGLRRLIEDEGLRQKLAAGARAAATELPTWRHSAELFVQALEATS